MAAASDRHLQCLYILNKVFPTVYQDVCIVMIGLLCSTPLGPAKVTQLYLHTDVPHWSKSVAALTSMVL